MERQLLRLLLALLKLLFQLVVFVATGAWPKFAKRTAEAKPAAGPTRPPGPQKKRARGEPLFRADRRDKPRPVPSSDGPWPFEFAAELSDPEPTGDDRADAARLVALAERRARVKLNIPALTSARGGRRSIASAVRDRRTVRAALVLGTALAPRPPRKRLR